MAYEDFTTFSEFDEGNDLSIDSATKVIFYQFYSRRDTGYIYKDKGANFFDGSFTHKFEVYISVARSSCWATFWMMSNTVGDFQDVVDASSDAHAFSLYDDTENLRLYLIENGSLVLDQWASPGPQLNTLYFIEMVRDDDGGSNNTGRLTAYIRTGSHSGILQDTLVVDAAVGEQNDFRYLYAIASRDVNAPVADNCTGYTQNMDLDAGVPAGWTGKVNGITNPAKINGIAVANISKVMGIS